MLGGCIRHIEESKGGLYLLLIEVLRLISLVIILLLEGTEKFLCSILRPYDLLHFFPDVLDVLIHDILLIS